MLLEDSKKEYETLLSLEEQNKFKERWDKICKNLKKYYDYNKKEKIEVVKYRKILVLNRPNSHSVNYLWRTLQ